MKRNVVAVLLGLLAGWSFSNAAVHMAVIGGQSGNPHRIQKTIYY